MRLKERSISFVANFLLGVAWASMLIGAITSFSTNMHNGILSALLFAILAMIPGAAAVLLLEHFFTLKANHEELQKQTRLLETLLEQNKE
ncbi:MAG: hypothetical protein DSZ10_04340 [Sulfurovum sp.]|nr:MAG: hypothetical protein DSZ10_04340 [Sulfurovum sp.]